MLGPSGGLPTQGYDREENILFVGHPLPVYLDTAAQLTAYFDEIVRYWRATCVGRKAYYLVDWHGFHTNLRENDTYAVQVKRVIDQCAVVIVRYSADPLARAAARLVAVKIHSPSHVYRHREEALQVIYGLQRGSIALG